MPQLAERCSFGFNANVDMIPVMNAVRKGLPVALAALAG